MNDFHWKLRKVIFILTCVRNFSRRTKGFTIISRSRSSIQSPMFMRTLFTTNTGITALVMTKVTSSAHVQSILWPCTRPTLGLALVLVCGSCLNSCKCSMWTNKTRVLVNVSVTYMDRFRKDRIKIIEACLVFQNTSMVIGHATPFLKIMILGIFMYLRFFWLITSSRTRDAFLAHDVKKCANRTIY